MGARWLPTGVPDRGGPGSGASIPHSTLWSQEFRTPYPTKFITLHSSHSSLHRCALYTKLSNTPPLETFHNLHAPDLQSTLYQAVPNILFWNHKAPQGFLTMFTSIILYHRNWTKKMLLQLCTKMRAHKKDSQYKFASHLANNISFFLFSTKLAQPCCQHHFIIEASLEVKLPTISTVKKQR